MTGHDRDPTRQDATGSLLAVGYVRVSTAEQGLNGVSLDAQQAAIAHEVERRGWQLADMASDTASGKTMRRRPGLEHAMRRLDRGDHHVLICSRLDRLSRSVGDFAQIMDRAQRNGWNVVCLDPAVDMTTPYGRAMAGVAAVFAQLERELIAQRTREGLAAARAAGRWKPKQSEIPLRTVTRIVELRKHDGLSSRKIAARLVLEGHQSLAHSTVLDVLRREGVPV